MTPAQLEEYEALTDRERLAVVERLELEILRPVREWSHPLYPVRQVP